MNSKAITFIKGIFAGVLIGLGGAANLYCCSISRPISGAILFSFGLLCVCFMQAYLFTGKVGYILANDKAYLRDVFIMAFGNIIGSAIIGYLFYLIKPGLNAIGETKLVFDESGTTINRFFNSFIRSIFAGIFVFLAVDGYKTAKHDCVKALIIILSITIMVVLGCNHSIANVFYFAYAQCSSETCNAAFLGYATVSILVHMLGNSLGSILLYLLKYSVVTIKK